jgi:hypothetical protein
MMRFMSIGFKINKKYRNCHQMVITEQVIWGELLLLKKYKV